MKSSNGLIRLPASCAEPALAQNVATTSYEKIDDEFSGVDEAGRVVEEPRRLPEVGLVERHATAFHGASYRNREIEYVFARIFNGELVHTRVRFRVKVHKWLGPQLAVLTGLGKKATSAFFRLTPEIFIMGR